jgi:hypothetical protein
MRLAPPPMSAEEAELRAWQHKRFEDCLHTLRLQ